MRRSLARLALLSAAALLACESPRPAGAAPIAPAAVPAPNDAASGTPPAASSTATPPAPEPAPSAAPRPAFVMPAASVEQLWADREALYYTTSNAVARRALGQSESVTLAPASRVVHLTGDADRLYYALDDGSVHAVAKTGGDGRRLFAKPGLIGGLSVHGEHVYLTWSPAPTTPSRTPPNAGSLLVVPRGGGPARTLASRLTGPGRVTAAPEAAYVIGLDVRVETQFDLEHGRHQPVPTERHTVHRVPLPNGPAKLLEQGGGALSGLASTADRLFWWTGAELVTFSKADGVMTRRPGVVLGADTDSLYVLENGALVRRPAAGGPDRIVAPEPDSVALLAASDADVYWISESPKAGRRVLRAPK